MGSICEAQVRRQFVVGWKGGGRERPTRTLAARLCAAPPPFALTIARGIGGKLEAEGCATESMRHAMQALDEASRSDNTPDAATR